MKYSIFIALLLLTFTSIASAQSTKSKIEIGVQATSLTVFNPDFPGDVSELGFGGRVGYNFNRALAAEAEVNFYPTKNSFFIGQGRAVQAQFGVKAGKRFEKFGVFAKVRPGFLSFGDVFSLQPGSTALISGTTFPNVRISRETYFTTDLGAVLELYPSKRTVVRLEAGDTLVRHPERYDFSLVTPGALAPVRGSKFTNNFQFTAGVGFRLGDYEDDGGVTSNSTKSQTDTPRYEVGVQFTSLSVHPPPQACFLGCLIGGDLRIETEPGFGGRFTYNLNDNFGLEAEGNFFTRKHSFFTEPGGYMFQGQFGLKAGKRFNNWGIFAKARPGFVGFTQAFELVGTHTQPFGNITITVGDFEVGKAFYPSFDFGGVVEFYVSRNWMARLDFGDTIIRYGEYKVQGFSAVTFPIFTRTVETRHNFQFNAGLGFRF